MTATTIRVQMAQRKDTAAGWTAANPILLLGEIGYETDTKKFKIGDGTTNWNSLAYLPIPDGSGNLTITGNLEIGSTGTLTFEGSTADGFETTLAVTDPTADRTITLPDVNGTVVTTGDTGSVTSAMITDGTIVNADINASAEIAVSKLANGTANQVLVTDGTDVSWSDNLTLAGDLTVNGTTTTINTQDLLVEDKNIVIGNVDTPTDVTADGGGITLKGATDKTINWVDSTDAWTSSERFNVPSGTAAAPSLIFNGDVNSGLYSPGADQVAISTNGTGRLFVDASGNVGVGTSAPGEQLSIAGAANVFASLASSGGVKTQINAADATSAGAIGTVSNHPLRLETNNTERLRITSDGKLGLGTSSPQGTLNVQGGGTSPSLTYDTNNIANFDAGGVQFAVGINSSSPFGAFLQARDNANAARAITLNPAGGNVGIGTVSPENKLHIVGTSATTNSGATILVDDSASLAADIGGSVAFRGTDGGTTRTYGLIRGGKSDVTSGDFSGYLAFETRVANQANTSERLRITSDGKVGIGTTSPGQKLTVGDGTPTGVNYIRVHAAKSDALIGQSGGSAFGLGASTGTIFGSDAAFPMAVGTFQSQDLLFGTNNTERARIDSSGRLLIGTSSARSNFYGGASALLNVEGVLSAPGRLVSQTFGNSNAEGPISVFAKHRSTSIGGVTTVQSGDQLGLLSFQGADGTNFVEAAAIQAQVDGTPGANDMPGRLVFSTTADGASSPTERMRIGSNANVRCTQPNTNDDGLTIDSTNGSFAASLVTLTTTRAAGTDCLFLYGLANAAQAFIVYNNGNVLNGNNSYTGISDIKLKENIVDANSQWDDIKALRVVNYNFKPETGAETFKQLGLIAQEVETVCPGLVGESPDRDAEGNDLGTVTKSVNYSVLYMKAVKALQEAMKRIETLEAKVAALEGV